MGKLKMLKIKQISVLAVIVHAVCFAGQGEAAAPQGECAAFCPVGWKSQGYNCYKLFDEKKNWTMAEAHCMGLGGHLVSVQSPEEHKFVADLGLVSDEEAVYMGGSDFVEKKWVWSDGTPFGFTYWLEGEPNNAGGEDCMMLWKKVGDKWNDVPCDRLYKFMCKIMYAKISLS